MKLVNRLTNWINRKSSYPLVIKHWNMGGPPDIITQVFNAKWHADWLERTEISKIDFKKILVFAPHQDDEAIGCAGLLLKASEAQKSIVFLTAAVQNYKNMAAVDFVNLRKEEAKKACNILTADPIFLDAPNSSAMVSEAYITKSAEYIAQFNPDLVLVPWLFDKPILHRYASLLIFRALQEAKIDLSTPIWQYQVHNLLPCNLVIDIGDVMEKKLESIRQYVSQMETIQAYDYLIEGLNMWNSQFLAQKIKKSYAEIFFGSSFEFYSSIFTEFSLESNFSYLKFQGID